MAPTIPGADTQTSVSLGQQSSLLPLKSQNSIAATSPLIPVESLTGGGGNLGTGNPVTGKGNVTGLDQQGAANLGQRPLAPVPGNVPGSSLQSVLTRGGMLIQALFEAHGNESAGPVAGARPVLDPAQLKQAAEAHPVSGLASLFAGSEKLASNLASEVEHSGLFYESHLQSFLGGSRSISEIMKEPQVRLSLPDQFANGQSGDDAMPPGMDARVMLLARLTTLQLSPSPAPGATADAAVALLRAGLALPSSAETPQQSLTSVPGQSQGQNQNQDQAHNAAQNPEQSQAAAMTHPASRPLRSSDLEQAYGVGPKPGLPAGFGVGTAQRSYTDLLAARGEKIGDDQPLSEDHTSARLAQSAIHPAAESTVRQQLELLASDTWRWQGELAAGQQMQWEIRRREAEPDREQPGSGSGNPERSIPATHTWQTRVSLHLPFLGKVDFQIDLGVGQLHAQVQAATAESLGILEEHSPPLRERLSAHSQGQSSLNIYLGPAVRMD